MTEIAGAAGISVETLRKIETGRIPTPAFFTIAAVCESLDVSLDLLADSVSEADRSDQVADVT